MTMAVAIPATVIAPCGPERTISSTLASSFERVSDEDELIMIAPQFSVAARSSLACLAETGPPRLPQEVRIKVTTAAISASDGRWAEAAPRSQTAFPARGVRRCILDPRWRAFPSRVRAAAGQFRVLCHPRSEAGGAQLPARGAIAVSHIAQWPRPTAG